MEEEKNYVKMVKELLKEIDMSDEQEGSDKIFLDEIYWKGIYEMIKMSVKINNDEYSNQGIIYSHEISSILDKNIFIKDFISEINESNNLFVNSYLKNDEYEIMTQLNNIYEDTLSQFLQISKFYKIYNIKYQDEFYLNQNSLRTTYKKALDLKTKILYEGIVANVDTIELNKIFKAKYFNWNEKISIKYWNNNDSVLIDFVNSDNGCISSYNLFKITRQGERLRIYFDGHNCLSNYVDSIKKVSLRNLFAKLNDVYDINLKTSWRHKYDKDDFYIDEYFNKYNVGYNSTPYLFYLENKDYEKLSKNSFLEPLLEKMIDILNEYEIKPENPKFYQY